MTTSTPAPDPLREALDREHDLRVPGHTVTLDPTCPTCRLLNEDRPQLLASLATLSTTPAPDPLREALRDVPWWPLFKTPSADARSQRLNEWYERHRELLTALEGAPYE